MESLQNIFKQETFKTCKHFSNNIPDLKVLLNDSCMQQISSHILYLHRLGVELADHYSPFAKLSYFSCGWFSFNNNVKKKVRKKSRECHNHKPQTSQTPRGRGNRQIQTSTNRTNVRKALRLALSSPSEVIDMLYL